MKPLVKSDKSIISLPFVGKKAAVTSKIIPITYFPYIYFFFFGFFFKIAKIQFINRSNFIQVRLRKPMYVLFFIDFTRLSA